MPMSPTSSVTSRTPPRRRARRTAQLQAPSGTVPCPARQSLADASLRPPAIRFPDPRPLGSACVVVVTCTLVTATPCPDPSRKKNDKQPLRSKRQRMWGQPLGPRGACPPPILTRISHVPLPATPPNPTPRRLRRKCVAASSACGSIAPGQMSTQAPPRASRTAHNLASFSVGCAPVIRRRPGGVGK